MSFEQVKARLDAGHFEIGIVQETTQLLRWGFPSQQKDELIISLALAALRSNATLLNELEIVKNVLNGRINELEGEKKEVQNHVLTANKLAEVSERQLLAVQNENTLIRLALELSNKKIAALESETKAIVMEKRVMRIAAIREKFNEHILYWEKSGSDFTILKWIYVITIIGIPDFLKEHVREWNCAKNAKAYKDALSEFEGYIKSNYDPETAYSMATNKITIIQEQSTEEYFNESSIF